MSFLGILAKNLATSTVKTGFNIVKATGSIIEEQYEKSRLENLLQTIDDFDEDISHYSTEEQGMIAQMSKEKAMELIAEKQAIKRNNYSYLAKKYPKLNERLLKDKKLLENK